MGYEFDNDSEFLDFCKKRVFKMSISGTPHYYEFWLDYDNKENEKKFIGRYSDDIQVKQEGNRMVFIISKGDIRDATR